MVYELVIDHWIFLLNLLIHNLAWFPNVYFFVLDIQKTFTSILRIEVEKDKIFILHRNENDLLFIFIKFNI